MGLLENRTELERLLAEVSEYEDPRPGNRSLPKWLFAITLTGAVVCTFSPSDVVAPVMTVVAPASEKLSIDKVSSENVAEDLDFSIAQHAASTAGWRAFLEAHPEGAHAKAAHAEIDRLLSAAPPQAVEVAEQPSASSPPAPAPVMVQNEPAVTAQPVEVTEQTPPSSSAKEASVDVAQSPAPPVMVETGPAPSLQPKEVAEQTPPPRSAAQAAVDAAQSSAPAALHDMVENESVPPPIPAVAPDAVGASTPLPPLRPREIAVTRSEEPAHQSQGRTDHQANKPNIFNVLVAQLFHPRRHRSDAKFSAWRR
jgi:hypothetical protein